MRDNKILFVIYSDLIVQDRTRLTTAIQHFPDWLIDFFTPQAHQVPPSGTDYIITTTQLPAHLSAYCNDNGIKVANLTFLTESIRFGKLLDSQYFPSTSKMFSGCSISSTKIDKPFRNKFAEFVRGNGGRFIYTYNSHDWLTHLLIPSGSTINDLVDNSKFRFLTRNFEHFKNVKVVQEDWIRTCQENNTRIPDSQFTLLTIKGYIESLQKNEPSRHGQSFNKTSTRQDAEMFSLGKKPTLRGGVITKNIISSPSVDNLYMSYNGTDTAPSQIALHLGLGLSEDDFSSDFPPLLQREAETPKKKHFITSQPLNFPFQLGTTESNSTTGSVQQKSDPSTKTTEKTTLISNPPINSFSRGHKSADSNPSTKSTSDKKNRQRKFLVYSQEDVDNNSNNTTQYRSIIKTIEQNSLPHISIIPLSDVLKDPASYFPSSLNNQNQKNPPKIFYICQSLSNDIKLITDCWFQYLLDFFIENPQNLSQVRKQLLDFKNGHDSSSESIVQFFLNLFPCPISPVNWIWAFHAAKNISEGSDTLMEPRDFILFSHFDDRQVPRVLHGITIIFNCIPGHSDDIQDMVCVLGANAQLPRFTIENLPRIRASSSITEIIISEFPGVSLQALTRAENIANHRQCPHYSLEFLQSAFLGNLSQSDIGSWIPSNFSASTPSQASLDISEFPVTFNHYPKSVPQQFQKIPYIFPRLESIPFVFPTNRTTLDFISKLLDLSLSKLPSSSGMQFISETQEEPSDVMLTVDTNSRSLPDFDGGDSSNGGTGDSQSNSNPSSPKNTPPISLRDISMINSLSGKEALKTNTLQSIRHKRIREDTFSFQDSPAKRNKSEQNLKLLFQCSCGCQSPLKDPVFFSCQLHSINIAHIPPTIGIKPFPCPHCPISDHALLLVPAKPNHFLEFLSDTQNLQQSGDNLFQSLSTFLSQKNRQNRQNRQIRLGANDDDENIHDIDQKTKSKTPNSIIPEPATSLEPVPASTITKPPMEPKLNESQRNREKSSTPILFSNPAKNSNLESPQSKRDTSSEPSGPQYSTPSFSTISGRKPFPIISDSDDDEEDSQDDPQDAHPSMIKSLSGHFIPAHNIDSEEEEEEEELILPPTQPFKGSKSPNLSDNESLEEYTPKTSNPTPNKHFNVGDRIQSLWEDNQLYSGTIYQVFPQSKYGIVYDDGDNEANVSESLITPLEHPKDYSLFHFTGILPSPVVYLSVKIPNQSQKQSEEKWKKIIKDLGGKITSEWSLDVSIIVRNVFRRTDSVLAAVAAAIPIVTLDYLEQCKKMSCFLDPEPFLWKSSGSRKTDSKIHSTIVPNSLHFLQTQIAARSLDIDVDISLTLTLEQQKALKEANSRLIHKSKSISTTTTTRRSSKVKKTPKLKGPGDSSFKLSKPQTRRLHSLLNSLPVPNQELVFYWRENIQQTIFVKDIPLLLFSSINLRHNLWGSPLGFFEHFSFAIYEPSWSLASPGDDNISTLTKKLHKNKNKKLATKKSKSKRAFRDSQPSPRSGPKSKKNQYPILSVSQLVSILEAGGGSIFKFSSPRTSATLRSSVCIFFHPHAPRGSNNTLVKLKKLDIPIVDPTFIVDFLSFSGNVLLENYTID